MAYDETGWDIVSGTVIEEAKAQEVVLSAHGMNKIEFDDLVLEFQIGIELRGWIKIFSGYNAKGDFEVKFKLKQ